MSALDQTCAGADGRLKAQTPASALWCTLHTLGRKLESFQGMTFWSFSMVRKKKRSALRSTAPLQTANHVLGQHQYRPPGDDGMTMTSELQDRYSARESATDEPVPCQPNLLSAWFQGRFAHLLVNPYQ